MIRGGLANVKIHEGDKIFFSFHFHFILTMYTINSQRGSTIEAVSAHNRTKSPTLAL